MDWNSDGRFLAFVEHQKGLIIYDTPFNNPYTYYPINTNQSAHAVDWSPDDKMIAFTIYNTKTVIINVMTRTVIE